LYVMKDASLWNYLGLKTNIVPATSKAQLLDLFVSLIHCLNDKNNVPIRLFFKHSQNLG
jgi:hypothetical protein